LAKRSPLKRNVSSIVGLSYFRWDALGKKRLYLSNRKPWLARLRGTGWTKIGRHNSQQRGTKSLDEQCGVNSGDVKQLIVVTRL